MEISYYPLWLSVKLSIITALLLLILGVPTAYFLARWQSKYKFLVEAVVSLPLVLPPSVLGFYLLMMFSPNAGMGLWLKEWLGIQLVFTFTGLVVGSIIYSFPFMVQPVQSAIEHLPKSLSEAARTMGKNESEILWRVILPNIRPALLSGLVLSFAHTMGEFGVVLMLGGNIPEVTRVASLAVYDEVEALNYSAAHFYALVLLVLSFGIIAITYWINKKTNVLGA
ncbi:MAG: molybdate ABC transporter permease subunit [Saprospiraceae bacterium]|nr:molybdate ABC transporter permease subunit [Saprospiraceae bacterium]